MNRLSRLLGRLPPLGSLAYVLETNSTNLSNRIVEDLSLCEDSSCTETELAPFADFGTVEFTGASAIKSGSTVGVTGADVITLSSNGAASGEHLSTCSDTSSTVTCVYG